MENVKPLYESIKAMGEAPVYASGVKPETHDLLVKNGFKSFSHGPNHQGYLDKGESNLKVADAIKHMQAQGYRQSHFRNDGKPINGVNVNGFKTWAFVKDAPGLYSEHHVSIDSEHGTHARHIAFHTSQDRS